MLLASLGQAAVLRHALVVGANLGGGSLEPLRYAESDAQRFADLLVELGGFDAANVTVLYAPTRSEVTDAVHAHGEVARASDEDLFLVYYSGHADARGLRLGTELYPFEALRADIRAMDAEVKLGVLDACRAGTITRLKGAALSQPFLVEERLAAEGEAWITAASADESAQESDQLRGSFFTHYLVSGMRGAADRSGDGEVSLEEAYQYASDRVVDHTGGTQAGTQHPMYDYNLKGSGDLALTSVAKGRAVLTLPSDLAGRVTVLRLPDRTPVAEVPKVPGKPVSVAVAPGTYLLRNLEGKTFRETQVGVDSGARLTVSMWGPPGVPAGGMVKGELLVANAAELARRTARDGETWMNDAMNVEDLRHSPLVSAGASVLLPGAGQFYNRQWVKGALFLGGTAALLGSSVWIAGANAQFFDGAITGPDPLRLGAAMLYGAAIADAAYTPMHREATRPYRGWTIATHAAWDGDADHPFVAGISADVAATEHLMLGLDRVGWTRDEAGTSNWNFGSRLALATNSPRWRSAAFVALGGRVRDTVDAAPEPRLVVGGGLDIRYYVTPRYFLDFDGRAETDGGTPVVLLGGGLGVHLGG